jgi:hypothetical protein
LAVRRVGTERGVVGALCLVEPRGSEPPTSCMLCQPRYLTPPTGALPGTASALAERLRDEAPWHDAQSRVGVACGSLLTLLTGIGGT